MQETRALIKRIGVGCAALALTWGVTAASQAQTVVQFSGRLMIGFGDSDNPTDLANNAIPVCDPKNPFAPGGKTFGSLPFNGRAVQTPMGGLNFGANSRGDGAGPQVEVPSNGGARVRVQSTCNVSITPFINPDFRSRIQAQAEIFPGIKGPFQGNATTMGAGFNTPVPVVPPTWMVGTGMGAAFTGMTLNQPIPFFPVGFGGVQIVKGPNNYGGAIQYQGGGGVQLGQNLTAMTAGGLTVMNFGQVPYINGFLPTDPTVMGTDMVGKYGPGPTVAFPNGLIAGNQRTMAVRTPGGTTINQQGKIRTTMGLHTPTGMGIPLRTPVLFQGAFFEWTTGMVRHTDMVGRFATARTATGFDDRTLTTMTAMFGTTRKLQLVSPWSASIRKVGPLPLPIQQTGFGGLAVLDIKIIPVPEPGSASLLVAGAMGLAAWAGVRRRRS